MGVEIERKFLVKEDRWRGVIKPSPDFYRQGYLYSDALKTIRVRVANANAWLTIKGETKGASRPEFEYEIPIKDAKELLDMFTKSSVEKYRYKIEYSGKCWEVDEFKGANEGLLIAEIELTSESEKFDVPDWIGAEVTFDRKYTNAFLAEKPFSSW